MNKVILIGHLCAAPDVRYSQGENSMAVARYRLAVDRRYKREDEQNVVLSTVWHLVRTENLLKSICIRE